MTLHVFNPEHDIALAANLGNFTAPRAGRLLRRGLGFLPALWAKEGDGVLVDDVESARSSLCQLASAAKEQLGISMRTEVAWQDSRSVLRGVDAVNPWGWDVALRRRLSMMGVADDVLPDDGQLARIRELSHRRVAARVLGQLLSDGIGHVTGEVPVECFSAEEVEAAVARVGQAVIKAPWSSSGRGLRFVGNMVEGQSLQGWLRNVIDRQGSVMVEPLYEKVRDFGMEFEAHADGTVVYRGLSLFHTANGAYTGNIVATEQTKREMMGKYVSLETLDRLREAICHHLAEMLRGGYCGPLGIDMMVCNNVLADCKSARTELVTGQKERVNVEKGFLIHPCVEINLRRTMGHVALALTPIDDDRVAVMQVSTSALLLRALS